MSCEAKSSMFVRNKSIKTCIFFLFKLLLPAKIQDLYSWYSFLQKQTHSGWLEGEYIFSKFSFLVSYSFQNTQTKSRIYSCPHGYQKRAYPDIKSYSTPTDYSMNLSVGLSTTLLTVFQISTLFSHIVCLYYHHARSDDRKALKDWLAISPQTECENDGVYRTLGQMIGSEM